MLLTSGIIILILELLLIANFIVMSYRNKVVFSKSNFLYFIPVLLLTAAIYVIGQAYQNKTLDFFMIVDSVRYSMKVFTFEVNKTFVQAAIKDNTLFALSFYICTVLGGLTLVSSIIAIIKMTLVNTFRVTKRRLNGADIVLGNDKNAFLYAKANPNTIIWVDSLEKKLSNEEKESLFNNKIAFMYKPFNYKNINSYFASKKEIYHFIIFNETNNIRYTRYIDILTNENIDTDSTVFLHIEAPNEYINFVNNQMSKKAVNSNYKFIASCFNIYELIARNFVLNNTFIDYLNKNSIENGILKEDINVFFLGFGKTNYSLFQSCVLNNQFVGLCDDKLCNKLVNYYLYDSDEKTFNKELIARLHFDYYARKIDENIPPLEKICNLEFRKINIKSDMFIDEIESKMKGNSHNIIFVSFSNGVENASFAEVLEHYFYKKNIHIYYNIDNKYDILPIEFSNKLTPFGFKSNILTHDVIANDSLSRMAMHVNKTYNKISVDKLVEWEKLPIIEKYSNVYSAINLRFKLQMLGFNYEDVLNKVVSKEEYLVRLFENKTNEEIDKLRLYDSYDEYFKVNLRTIMAYQEHLRWCVYYYLNNFDQMNSSDFEFKNNKVIIKDLNEKRHGCLTTYYGLDILYNKMLDIYKNNNIDKNILDIESYKYDYMVLDNLYE